MRLEKLILANFRNIQSADLRPGEELTVITGANGQGKTNLLEAVWLLTGAKSFRGAKDPQLIREGQQFAVMEGAIFRQDRGEDYIRITVGTKESPRPGRTAKLNGADAGRASELAGLFTAVVFEPGDLELVKGSPERRRRFIDAALCQLYPGYLATLRRYSRLIAQKNSLLKFWERTPGAAEMCDAFDADLAVQGEEIRRRRAAFLDGLAPLAKKNYEEISSGSEALSLCYRCGFETGGLAGTLAASRMADRKAGYCTAGPHRDDLELELDGRPAKNFASQGQQRSAVLSIKLAQAALAAEVTGEHPVMLLDDVLSELDPARQEYLLTRVRQKQTIVTACDSSLFHKAAGVMLKMDGGRLSEG